MTAPTLPTAAAAAASEGSDDLNTPEVVGAIPPQVAADIVALAAEFSPWSFTEHETGT